VKGYIVIDAEISNREVYSEFAGKVSAAVAAHGGRLIVRTSNVEAIEGDWVPKRLVIVEFDSLEAAKGYIGSAQYMALDVTRRRATKFRIVVVEGCDSEA